MAVTRIPTLNQSVAFVDKDGRLTNEGLRRINEALKQAYDLALAAQAAADELASQLSMITAAQSDATDALGLAGSAVQQDQGPNWINATGTADRTAYASYAAPTVSATYVPTELQGVANEVQSISRRVVAIVNDLKANGALT